MGVNSQGWRTENDAKSLHIVKDERLGLHEAPTSPEELRRHSRI